MNAAVTNVNPAKPNTNAVMTTKNVHTPSNAAVALATAAASSLKSIEIDVDRLLGNIFIFNGFECVCPVKSPVTTAGDEDARLMLIKAFGCMNASTLFEPATGRVVQDF
jgi:hypothetical protein